MLCEYGHNNVRSYSKLLKYRNCRDCLINKQRNAYVDVKNEFTAKGLTLLDDTYIDSKSYLTFICHCGEKRQTTYDIIRKRTPECRSCLNKKEWERIVSEFLKYGGEVISPLREYDNHESLIAFKCKCGEIGIKTYKYLLSKQTLNCENCSKQQRDQTNLQKYGDSQLFKSDIIKEKIKSHYILSSGDETKTHNMHFSEIKQKAKETNMQNHGGVHNFNLPENRKQSQEAFFKKYGSKHGTVDSIKLKMFVTNNMRYCVDYPLQSHLTFKFKEYTFPCGMVVRHQGYENFAYNDLSSFGFSTDDITSFVPQIAYVHENKHHTYTPDVFIRSLSLLIEIKSDYTLYAPTSFYKNISKFDTACKDYNFLVLVYDEKGNHIEMLDYTNGDNENIAKFIEWWNKSTNNTISDMKNTNCIYEKYKQQLEEAGWEMITPPPSNFETIKTLDPCEIKCSKGHTCLINYMFWKRTKGCKGCRIEKSKTTFEDVKAVFAAKNLVVTSNESDYKSYISPIKCYCEFCETNYELNYKNVNRITKKYCSCK